MDKPPTTVSQAQLVDGGSPGKKLPQYLAALSATIGALAAGTMLGWSSPASDRLQNGEYGFPVSDADFAWIASIATLGAALVCYPIGFIMEKIGRKWAMLLLVAPFTLGWLLIILAGNVSTLLAGRFFIGLAGGGFCVTAPAYNNEISQLEIRGTTGTFFQLMITVGILFAYAVGSYVKVYILSIICAVIPIVFGVVFFFMPESPYYLLTANKPDEAKKSMVRLRGADYDCDAELNEIQKKINEEIDNPSSFVESFKHKAAIMGLIICLNLMIYQQFSGINAVLFNANTIFQSAGESISPKVSTIIIGVIQVVATFCSTLVIDKLGRKILLLVSSITMCICDTLLGVFFYLKEHDPDSAENITWLPLVSLCIFIVAFSIGYGPIPWLVSGELCAPSIKAFVSSSAGTFNWIMAFIITRTFVDMQKGMGEGGAFWFFAGVTLVGVIFVIVLVPETKGKNIEEVQQLLKGNKSSNKYVA